MQESCLFTYVQSSPESTGEAFHWTQQDLFQLKWPFGNFFVLESFPKGRNTKQNSRGGKKDIPT